MWSEVDGTPWFATAVQTEGCDLWWPCKDHPSDKADSVRITTTVPDPLKVASNGLAAEPVSHVTGRTTYEWFESYPITTYLVSIAAGVYDVYNQIYVRPDSLAAEFGPLELPVIHFEYPGTNAFEGRAPGWGWHQVVDMLAVLEYWFGPYPFPLEKYGHAHFTWGGGMEHQTISSMGGDTWGLVSHELAHQWYGDAITMETWPDLWLNEGFATYAEILYWEAINPLFQMDEDPTNDDPAGRVFANDYARALMAEGTMVLQDTTSFGVMFDPLLVYAKGGLVLHMLRRIVGDDDFREILRTYAARPDLRYSTATTADFKGVAESVSGHDLDYFFRQWVIEGTGYPIYRADWRYAPSGSGYDVTVDLQQTQTPETSNITVFEMPITLEIHTTAGPERFTVWNDQRRQQFILNTAHEPLEIAVDPDRDILRSVEGVSAVATEAPAARAAVRIEAAYPEPASGQLNVSLSLEPSDPAEVGLYDVIGRRVRVARVDSGSPQLQFDVSGLPAGAYYLRLEQGHNSDVRAVTLVNAP